MKRLASQLVAALLLGSVAGCAGSGAGSTPSGPVTSTLSFPLQSAYISLVVSGWSKTFVVSGDCSGTGSTTSAPASTPATFETVTGFSAVQTTTMSLAGCTPSSIASGATNFYDTNFNLLGFSSTGNYGVVQPLLVIPASVMVGSTGNVGTITLYTDSAKSVGNGRQDWTYVVEADTADTAIINRIVKLYDASSTLLSTEQDRYRIAATGALVPLSADIQFASPALHLVLTYN